MQTEITKSTLRVPSLRRWGAFALLLGAGVLPACTKGQSAQEKPIEKASQELSTNAKPELVPQIDYGALLLTPREDNGQRARWLDGDDRETYSGVVQWRHRQTREVLRTVPLAAQPLKSDFSSSPVFTALSPQGEILANVGRDKVLYWQDTWSGVVLNKFPNQSFPLSFSPDGKKFVCQQLIFRDKKYHHSLVLRSVPDGQILREAPLPSRFDRVAWSPDAARFAIAGQGSGTLTLQMWDTANKRSLWKTRRKSEAFLQMWFLSDNRLALLEREYSPVGSSQGDTFQVHILKADGKPEVSLSHVPRSRDLDVSWDILSDGRLLISETPANSPAKAGQPSPKRVTYLWDVLQAAAPRLLKPNEKALADTVNLRGGSSAPLPPKSSLASPVSLKRVRLTEGRILVADDSRLWEAATGKLRGAFQPIPPRASALDIAPDGKIFASAGGGGGGSSSGAFLGVWQSTTRKLLWHKAVSLDLANGNSYSEAGSSWATALSFSRDGQCLLVASALDQPPLALYQARSGKQIWAARRQLQGHIGYEFTNASWSDDNALIATSSRLKNSYYSTQVQIISATSGRMLSSWIVPSPGSALAWSRDNRSIAVATATGRVFHGSGYSDFEAGEYIVQLRSPRAGRIRSTLRGASAALIALRFSPDGSHLAGTSQSGDVYVWEIQSGKLLHTLHGHFASARDVMWSGDDKIISVGEDGAARFWSARSGKLLATALMFQTHAVSNANNSHDTHKSGFGGGEFEQLSQAEWLLYTPVGYYAASPGAEKFIRWRVGRQLFPAQKYKAKFHQPARALAALRN